MQIIEQSTNQPELDTIAKYYFDGQGKALRPMVCMLMARAINYHIHKDNRYVCFFFSLSLTSSSVAHGVFSVSRLIAGYPPNLGVYRRNAGGKGPCNCILIVCVCQCFTSVFFYIVIYDLSDLW